MKKLIKLKNSDIKKIVNLVLEQDSNNDVESVEVSPEKYLEIMKYAGYYARGVANLPQFKNKNIIITGSLNLNNTPTKSLDGIKVIQGSLDISGTQVSSIDGIQIKGYVSDWNTPLRKIKEKRIRNAKIAESNIRREDDEWRLDTGYGKADDEAYVAHAILEYLINNEKVKVKTEKDLARLEELNEMLENLQDKESEYEEQDKDLTDIHADIQVTEDEIEEINNKMDVYNLVPEGTHYRLPRFEVIGNDDLEGNAYCAGRPEDVESAAKDYVRGQIDEGGYEHFNPSFVEYSIDVDYVVDYFRDYYEDDIRNNPDMYFNDDDYELTEEQRERITELENQISELEERQSNIENEAEEPGDVSVLWDKIQEKIDELESEKDDIEPEIGEPTEEMIDDKLEDMLTSVRRHPVDSLKDIGVEDLTNFIDENEFIDSVIDSDGLGILNHYDGSYDSVYVNGEEFYVMRLD